jgi:hypothetical protein
LPSLIPHSDLANDIKQQLLRDMFDLLDITNDRQAMVQQQTQTLLQDRRVINAGFTHQQVQQCVRLDLEYQHRRAFELVFPTSELTASIVQITSSVSKPLDTLLRFRELLHHETCDNKSCDTSMLDSGE